ncbi:MAG TPA: PA14 domain-containing protein [Candidatus Limnocylindrales bacterium]|nr:PA14 domain-containing protein [Candidatus Limnocylindrales bacterium]
MKITKPLLCAIGLAGLASLPVLAAPMETPGFLKLECWFSPLRNPSLTGTAVGILQSDPNYPNTPDMVSYVSGMDTRPVFPDNTHDEYGLKLSGWITPSVTDDYYFYLRSDDASQLYISQDATEINGLLVAEEPSCCLPFQEPGNQETTYPIHMVAGQKYALYILLKEGGGDDFVQVAMQSATGTTPAASLAPLASTMLSSMPDSAGASLNITQQPANGSTAENVAVSFSVAATGTSSYGQYTAGGSGTSTAGLAAILGTKNSVAVFYQWFTNGVEVRGANSTNYTITWPKKAQDGTKVKCYVAVPGLPKYSSEATLTVTADTTPPTVVKVTPDLSFTSLLVKYSEPVTDTAVNKMNYGINQGVTISTITRVDLQTVKLTTSKMPDSTVFTLTINGVQDTATPANNIANNTQIQFRSYVFMAGTVLHQKYTGFDNNTGYNDNNLFNDPRYPLSPTRQDLMSFWEYPKDGQYRDLNTEPNGPENRYYMDVIQGFVIPPATADYVFFIDGADKVTLYLSTDDSPANKKAIATLSGWTNPRDWNLGQPQNDPTTPPTDMVPARSDTYAGTLWPNGNTITLTNGHRYYMELVHYDPSWAGADDFAATYKLAGEADPVPGDAPRLTGSMVGFYFDPTGASVNFTLQPQNASVAEGGTATLTAAATGTSAYGTNVIYQWQSAPKGSSTFTNIPGATTASFKTPLLTLADDGTQYRVVATVPPISENSSVATVTVLHDTTPPVPTVGAMLDTVAGTVDVGVTFDEPCDSASVGALANYSVSSGNITSIEVFTNRFTPNSRNPLVMILKQSVLLKVTGLSGSGNLTIKNIADIHGNAISTVTLPFTVDTKLKWGVVGANEFGGINAVVPVAANGYDLYSDGVGEWASYDEATFVYEQLTGDFDKKLRVEYQDGSSQWSRAGLIARDVLNFGVDRAAQTGGQAGRYQKCFVTPVGATLTGPGTSGAQDYELNRRLDTGGITDGAPFSGANIIPPYPNAWCRIQRVGQTFNLFRSSDGVNWVKLGATTWGVDDASKTPMPATLYVGPEFAPEIGNVPQVGDKGTFLARIRDYGDYVATFDPQLKLTADATGKLTITWSTGTLVSSSTANGTYSPVSNATSPYPVTPTGTATFYRVKQ